MSKREYIWIFAQISLQFDGLYTAKSISESLRLQEEDTVLPAQSETSDQSPLLIPSPALVISSIVPLFK